MRSMSLIRVATVGAVLAIGISSVALAAADPVPDRQEVMKAIGQFMKEGAAVSSPKFYDAAKAKPAMDGVAASSKKLTSLFPAGSGPNANPKTAALPSIWANQADFDKRLAEMATLANAAGATTTIETYKPAFAALGATCKSCHDIYRKP